MGTHPPKYQLQFEFQLYWSVLIYWAQSNHQTSKANCPRTSKDINSGAQWTTLRTASEIRKEMLKFRVSLEWKAHYVNCEWDSTLLWRSLENPFVKIQWIILQATVPLGAHFSLDRLLPSMPSIRSGPIFINVFLQCSSGCWAGTLATVQPHW